MAIYANEDTEFNDALRKHGILPPLPKPPRTPSPPPKRTLEEEAEDMTADELERLTEDANEETERLLEAMRRARLQDEKREREIGRFGRVYPIGRDDYTREITEASKVDDDSFVSPTVDDDLEASDTEDQSRSRSIASGNGTGVVCFLYKDGIPASDRTFQQIHTLAARHPRTKFVSIVGDKCIPNLPDGRIPMILVYRKGEIKQQIVGWARDKERRIEELEAFLIVSGAIIPSSIPQNNKTKDNSDEDDFSDEDDPSSKMRSAATSTNRRAPKNIRDSRDDDSDSDFDL